MKVFVTIKQAGKKRPVLEKKEYAFDPAIRTLRQLLSFFAQVEVAKYNSRDEESFLLYSDAEELTDLASEGKISFGHKNNPKKADPAEAVERTLQSFTDGLVRVFCNGEELSVLDDTIEINDGDVFTFVKLTFLAGRMW